MPSYQKRKSIAVTILLDTDDRNLWPENLDLSTAQATHALRQRVVNALPELTRVICIMSEADARLMHSVHEQAAREAGLADITRPPADYQPPGKTRPGIIRRR